MNYLLNAFITPIDRESIYKASKKLKSGFEALDNENHAELSRLSQKTRQLTDKISQEYIKQIVKLSSEKDSQKMFKYKEILSQLKSIASKIHTAANTLQDIIEDGLKIGLTISQLKFYYTFEIKKLR
jgi:uncharacterized protein Yka (UPF0111/DUF47 family)